MAKRFHMEFPTLQGVTWAWEVHDNVFGGASTEVDGNFEGLGYEMSGDGDDIFSPVVGRLATVDMVIPDATVESFVDDIAGAREGRFQLVVKRNGAIDFVGYIIPQQVSYPDAYYPYHITLTAVDGLARLRSKDYKQTNGSPHPAGRVPVVEHIFNCLSLLGNDLAGITYPTNRLRTNVNWFDVEMVTTDCPIEQAEIEHDRFKSKDRAGLDKFWSAYDVLLNICTLFGARFYYAAGSWWFMQPMEYENTTQKLWNFDITGAALTPTTGVDFDKTIDFVAAWKQRGGDFGFLKPVFRVISNYHHQTKTNRAQGLFFSFGNEGPYQLIGPVSVDASDKVKIRAKLTLRSRTTYIGPMPSGYVWPIHRYFFNVTVQCDGLTPEYLKRTLTSPDFYTNTPGDIEWTTLGGSVIEVAGGTVVVYSNGQDVFSYLEFTSPTLDTDQDGSPIFLGVELDRIEDVDGNILTNTGVGLAFTWGVENPLVEVLDESADSVFQNDTLQFKVNDTASGNYFTIEKDTFFGDGPNILSLSSITVNGVPTSSWKIGGTGTGYDINELLIREVLNFRNTPADMYTGVYIKGDIDFYSRIISDDRAWIPIRMTYSAFYDLWGGDWVAIARAPVTIETTPPVGVDDNPFIPDTKTPSIYIPPPDLPTPPLPLPPGPTLPPPDGLVVNFANLNTLQGATLNGTQGAADINATTPNQITVNAQTVKWAKKGETFYLINPYTGRHELLTIHTSYEPGDTFIKVVEDVVDDYPNGAWLVPSHATQLQLRGWSYYERDVTTPDFWAIPLTSGTLPSPSVYDAATLRERVEVYRGALRLFYDPNGGSPNNWEDTFGLKPSTNEIEFYSAVRGETCYVVVR